MYQNEKSPLRLYKEWAHSQIPAFKTLQMGQLRQFRGYIPITGLHSGTWGAGSAAWRSSLEKMIQSAQSPPESGLAVRTACAPRNGQSSGALHGYPDTLIRRLLYQAGGDARQLGYTPLL